MNKHKEKGKPAIVTTVAVIVATTAAVAWLVKLFIEYGGSVRDVVYEVTAPVRTAVEHLKK